MFGYELRSSPYQRPARPPSRAIIFTALAAGLLGGLAGGAIVIFALNGSPPPRPQPTPPTPTARSAQVELAAAAPNSVTEAVREVGPAVVTVINRMPDRISLFGTPIERTSSGSGFIISPDGFIVTNKHVIEGARELEIILADGTTLPARLVGDDPYADLAILQADGDMPGVASWGNSDALQPGEPLIAIGSPLGDFTNTVTVGVVSATERTIELDQDYALEGLIQTDAAINQGNSGGPLLNMAGEVVGVNTLIVRGNGQSSVVAEGLGFAIPSNTARAIAEQVIEKGYFARPRLGIRWVTITRSLAARYRLPVDHGIYIIEVETGGPADRAGLSVGDIILEIQGVPIDSEHPFQNQLFQFEPGDQISIRFQRQDRILEQDIDLGTMAG
ncbi:MAG: trypsin-like peptidase domain-containing protein [Anaerolineales bacterium]|nr:trypsin-like peptidase domain-containing protein [Anaerolineales bacterium]